MHKPTDSFLAYQRARSGLCHSLPTRQAPHTYIVMTFMAPLFDNGCSQSVQRDGKTYRGRGRNVYIGIPKALK